MNNDADDLLKELDRWFAEEDENAKRKRDNPYVLDLIRVLYPHPAGLHRSKVIDELWRRRGEKDLNMPKEFEKSVQSAFQQYAGEYATFQKRNAKSSDDIFYAPRGKGAGWWAVRLDRADAWLVAKKKEIGTG